MRWLGDDRYYAALEAETAVFAEAVHDADPAGARRLGVSLAERRHAANGVVFPDLSGPYFAEVVLGYEEVTSRLGRSVLILSTREQADPEAAVRELTSRVDGLAIFDATVGRETVRAIVAGGLPVVLLARGAEVEGADAVAAENTASAERLTRYVNALLDKKPAGLRIATVE